MISLGLGFSSSATTADVMAAVDAAISCQNLRHSDIDVLATADFKRDAGCLQEVAASMGAGIRFADKAALASVASKLVTRSAVSRNRTGSDCLCEAAALAVLSEDAALIMRRLVHGPVTCALARGAAR